MGCHDGCSRHVGRVLGIYLNIGHGGHDGYQYHIPVFARILVDANLHRLETLYFLRQLQECGLELLGHAATLIGAAFKFE